MKYTNISCIHLIICLLVFVVVYEYQTYIDPSDSNLRNVSPGGQQIGSSSPSQTGRVLLPLGDNVLTHNLGIPVIVLVTKVGTVVILSYIPMTRQ